VIQFFYHESAEAGMRGAFVDQGGLFSYIAPEARVPANHPLRRIRELVRDVLGELNRSLGKLYASEGRPSIPPEQLLSALGRLMPGRPASLRRHANAVLKGCSWLTTSRATSRCRT
jgi:hypothetical protein